MRIGLFTDGLDHLVRSSLFRWCAEREIGALELGVGGYSRAPHADLDLLLTEYSARRSFLAEVADAGLEIVCLNAAGNPLHPDRRTASDHDAALRGAIRLASLLNVDKVVAMSGCPGADGRSRWPTFAGGAWLPDMEGLWAWQWETAVVPYWRELSRWSAKEAPSVVICLELHPGACVYNVESYRRLREATDENVRVNLDPSHFWWQGIEPLVAIESLGDAIAFVHGKDTIVYPDRVALHGVLDFRWPDAADAVPWHFCAVGAGHDVEVWSKLLAALRAAGYDGVISIEHEDPRLSPAEGIEASLAGLGSVLRALEVRA